MSADQLAIIDRFLPRVAAALKVKALPPALNREQIARVAGLKDGRCLAAAASRGAKNGDSRWVAFRAAVGTGRHSVPSEKVAAWLAMDAGLLSMPAPVPGKEAETDERAGGDAGYSLQNAWRGQSRVYLG